MQDLGEDAPLHIGGLRLHCAGDSVQIVQGGQIAQGRRKHVSKSVSFSHNCKKECLNQVLLQVKQKSANAPQRQSSDDDSDSNDDSSDSDNILEDYLANLQCDSDNSNSYEQQVPLVLV